MIAQTVISVVALLKVAAGFGGYQNQEEELARADPKARAIMLGRRGAGGASALGAAPASLAEVLGHKGGGQNGGEADDLGSRIRRMKAMGQIGGDGKVLPFFAMTGALTRALQNDRGDWARVAAVESLVKIGDKQAVPALIKAMREDVYVEVRFRAAEALGEIGGGDGRAVLALTEALKNKRDEPVRVYAARALGKIGGEQEVPALTQALEKNGGRVNTAVTEALRKILGERFEQEVGPTLEGL